MIKLKTYRVISEIGRNRQGNAIAKGYCLETNDIVNINWRTLSSAPAMVRRTGDKIVRSIGENLFNQYGNIEFSY